MQTKSLRIKSYRSWPIADTASSEAITRMKKLELYDQLKSEGCSMVLRLQAIGWSKATYYRWLKCYHQQGWQGLEARSCRPQLTRARQWTKQHEQVVLHLRQRYRLWGKRKIWKVLCRDHGFTLSISTVGRILKRLIEYLRKQLPFELLSIQVDGGSEFRDEFEQACEALKLPLFVLPPRKPKWNGCVERANGTTRYEFYPFYQGALTIAAINRELEVYQNYYNHYRPHDGVGLETPMSYYQNLIQAS